MSIALFVQLVEVGAASHNLALTFSVFSGEMLPRGNMSSTRISQGMTVYSLAIMRTTFLVDSVPTPP